MKKLPLIILLFAAACSSKKDTAAKSASPDAVTVSMNGISDLKIGMTLQNVEKLLKRKLALPTISSDTSGFAADSVYCKYKEVDYMLILIKGIGENNATAVKVNEIRSSFPELRTPSGIVIGDDACKIISTYEGYRIDIMPNYYNYIKQPPVKIKGESRIWISDDETGHSILFHTKDNKVVAMSVKSYQEEGD
jgi:hypothetical protein